jgi:hypothetical protein
MCLFIKLGTTLVQEQFFPEDVRKTCGLQGKPTRWLAEERRPRDWVEPILKQSIASFYDTDFGRCLESFENMLRSKDGQRPKQHIEHSGDENGQHTQPDLYTM